MQSRFDTSRLDTDWSRFETSSKFDSIHVESRFHWTQPSCSQLFRKHSVIVYDTKQISYNENKELRMESISDDNWNQCRQPVRDRQQGIQCYGCHRWNHRTFNSSDIVSVFQSPLNSKACRAKYRMLDRIQCKIFLFLFFSDVCRSDSKSPISPMTFAGAVTSLATASICESDDSCFWNPFFFFIAFFQLENPFFVNAGSALD